MCFLCDHCKVDFRIRLLIATGYKMHSCMHSLMYVMCYKLSPAGFG